MIVHPDVSAALHLAGATHYIKGIRGDPIGQRVARAIAAYLDEYGRSDVSIVALAGDTGHERKQVGLAVRRLEAKAHIGVDRRRGPGFGFIFTFPQAESPGLTPESPGPRGESPEPKGGVSRQDPGMRRQDQGWGESPGLRDASSGLRGESPDPGGESPCTGSTTTTKVPLSPRSGEGNEKPTTSGPRRRLTDGLRGVQIDVLNSDEFMGYALDETETYRGTFDCSDRQYINGIRKRAAGQMREAPADMGYDDLFSMVTRSRGGNGHAHGVNAEPSALDHLATLLVPQPQHPAIVDPDPLGTDPSSDCLQPSAESLANFERGKAVTAPGLRPDAVCQAGHELPAEELFDPEARHRLMVKLRGPCADRPELLDRLRKSREQDEARRLRLLAKVELEQTIDYSPAGQP